MDATRRTTTLRRVAGTASLAALILLPAAQAEAKKPKSPTITKVTPMIATVGGKLTIKGKNFKVGKSKNSVGFKAAGHSVVFVRSDLSTTKTMTVKLLPRLEKVMSASEPTTFKLRVLSKRFGKGYTSSRLSPIIRPRKKAFDPDNPTADPSCVAGPGDQDGDLLSDKLEVDTLGTNACAGDTDGDGVSDGYEYRSAVDLNDDEYQEPNRSLPAPTKKPYANPLNAEDANIDYDGDGLSLAQEYKLWATTTPAADRTLEDPTDGRATPLNYSDGLQYSKSVRNAQNRRVPSLPASGYDKWADFLSWLSSNGYATVELHDSGQWYDHETGRFPYSILDVDRSGGVEADEEFALDRDNDGYLSDDERDEDADGLANVVEARMELSSPDWWNSCYDKESPYVVPYVGTDLATADTDGDGIRDGADDQDFDDVPNMMEISRIAASGYRDMEDGIKDTVTGKGTGPTCKPDADLLKQVGEDEQDNDGESDDPTASDQAQPLVPNHPDAYGQINPFNPCLPDPGSRSCPRVLVFGPNPYAPFGGPHWWSLN